MTNEQGKKPAAVEEEGPRMERFNVGPHVEIILLHPGHESLLSLELRLGSGRQFAHLSREEAAHLAGILIHCILQRGAPASAVKSFREMTIGQLLEARAFPGGIPAEEGGLEEPEEEAASLPFPTLPLGM